MAVGAIVSAIAGSTLATAFTLLASFDPIHVLASYPLGGMVAIMIFSGIIYHKQRQFDLREGRFGD